jgi:hypothetical protein
VTKGAPESDQAEISAAERWELLERIRNSREFKRALRLRELLLYIGTQTVKLSITSIREQEIGAAVFGRPDNYDTSLDNIVRVNVTELRKRLGLYFEDEGLASQCSGTASWLLCLLTFSPLAMIRRLKNCFSRNLSAFPNIGTPLLKCRLDPPSVIVPNPH